MLITEPEFFVQLPSETSGRVLHRVRVITQSGTGVVGEAEETGLEIDEDQEILIYYESRRAFVKQPARVTQVRRAGPEVEGEAATASLEFTVEVMGEPMSAESRQCYRVSTVISGVIAEFGTKMDCPLLDISSMGFAVLSTEQFGIAAVVPAAIEYDGKRFQGRASVQSITEVSNTQWRYGVHNIASREPDENLERGLQLLSMAIQREKLRRMTRAG